MEATLTAHNNPTPKRILIDLRWLFPGVNGGIENHARSLLKELANLDVPDQFIVVAPSQIKYDLGINNVDNFKVCTTDGPLAYARKLKAALLRLLHMGPSPEVEQLRRIASYQADVALSMPGYMYPDLKQLPNVLVVPDIQHEYYPEFFTPQELQDRRKLFGDSINHSVMILAISEFTRQSLIEKLAVPPDKIITTYLAADPIFQPGSPDQADITAVLEKYVLTGKQYFFFPGNTWKHKNHKTAIKALALLLESAPKDIYLVCTGSMKNAQPDLIDLITSLHLMDRVRFLGYCPRSDLPALYQGAVGLIFPSYFEGFGLPVLEAMLSNCPVICSRTSSLPKIAGKAALLCDPDSPAEFASAMQRILVDTQLRDDLIEKGKLQAAQFSWENCARLTLAALETASEVQNHPNLPKTLQPKKYRKRSGRSLSSRKDRAQAYINQGAEQHRLGRPFQAFLFNTISWFISPEVALYGLFFTSLSRLKRSGKIQRIVNIGSVGVRKKIF